MENKGKSTIDEKPAEARKEEIVTIAIAHYTNHLINQQSVCLLNAVKTS
jgi:hypothetical protein